MILREPDYYEEFRCLAAACPDSWGRTSVIT